MEMSHRSQAFAQIADKCRADIKAVLAVPENFTVLLFQGGASNQFSSICYNLLEDGKEQTANYVTTGIWSQGAIAEARKFCNANEVTNNKNSGCTSVADKSEWNVAQDAKFFHYCDNETV